MKKVLAKILTLTLILCGCHQSSVSSYFYDIRSDGLEKNLSINYEIDIKESNNYSIYLNYFVDDMNKWTETLDLLQEETGSEKYKSSVLIFDENKKLLYSVENFPITLHYGSYENRVLGLTLYPQYIPLQKGKKYFFQINTNINTLHFNNNKKQIEVTYRYKSK